MNESDPELRWRQLSPIEPSLELEQRIAAELNAAIVPQEQRTLSATPTAGRFTRSVIGYFSFPSLASGVLGAVGGAVAVLVLHPAPLAPKPTHAPSAAAALFEPGESTRELVAAESTGTLYETDGQPAEIVRSSSVERHTWTNPATGALVQVEIPREDLMLVPLSYQ